jgi:hypothetical protein
MDFDMSIEIPVGTMHKKWNQMLDVVEQLTALATLCSRRFSLGATNDCAPIFLPYPERSNRSTKSQKSIMRLIKAVAYGISS